MQVAAALLEASQNPPLGFHEDFDLAAEERIAALPIDRAQFILPLRQGFGFSRNSPQQFIETAVVDDQSLIFDVPVLFIEITPKVAAVTLRLKDDEVKGLPDVV